MREAAGLVTTVLQPPVVVLLLWRIGPFFTWITPCWINFYDLSQGEHSMRRLLLDPLFHQKDLFVPATVEETLQAAGDVVHLADGPTIPLRARLGILLARGVILLPARGVCSRTFRLPMDDSLLLLLVLLCLGATIRLRT